MISVRYPYTSVRRKPIKTNIFSVFKWDVHSNGRLFVATCTCMIYWWLEIQQVKIFWSVVLDRQSTKWNMIWLGVISRRQNFFKGYYIDQFCDRLAGEILQLYAIIEKSTFSVGTSKSLVSTIQNKLWIILQRFHPKHACAIKKSKVIIQQAFSTII